LGDAAFMSIDDFLEHYRKRELLRFLTCGSVDDGKSTLIGRLLHDSQGVYDDQLDAARLASVKHGTTGGKLDLALLMDGLQAEREQGITIDVAYRYFSTPRRKFIIADTPGHVQYTRNMATGASTCDLAVILVDATRGVLDQTRRHAFIATLLGIRHLVVGVNKMDLVDFSEARFLEIREEFSAFAAKLQISDVHFIPLSALDGDNVVHTSARTPWYRGGPLLDYLENLHIASDRNLIDLRLAVQLVERPSSTFRGYAGSVASGIIRRGDEVTILPSGTRTRVREIYGVDGPAEQAFAPMPITVEFEDQVDASRGDMLVHPNNAPRLEQEFEAMLVWMHQEPASQGREYLIKHTTVLAPAVISQLRYRINVNTLRREECDQLALNEIGRARVETARFLAVDSYQRNRATGAFILIDRMTNATVAAGMILDRDPAEVVLPRRAPLRPHDSHGPSLDDWQRRIGHTRFRIDVTSPHAAELCEALRDELFKRGFFAYVLTLESSGLDETLGQVGVSVIVPCPGSHVAHVKAMSSKGAYAEFDSPEATARDICDRLDAEGVLKTLPEQL
jgi:bifunctional enzyme CysN/CysC